MNTPLIDKVYLKTQVQEKARLMLGEITDENLKYFTEEVKKLAEGILEKYAFDIYDTFSTGAFTIENEDTLQAFSDFNLGYQAQMLKWINDNALKIEHVEIKLPKQPAETAPKTTNPIYPLTIGTVIATGLYIFTNIWVALAAEILTLALAYRQYLKNDKAQKQYALEKERYAHELKIKKDKLIQGLIVDLEKWLDQGKAESDRILASYNL